MTDEYEYNHALVKQITLAVRIADKKFEDVGGSTRHWVRDCLLPELTDAGLDVISDKPEKLEKEIVEPELKEIYRLPNGSSIFVDTKSHPAGGRVYYSNEGSGYVGFIHKIWDTCIVSQSTLLAMLLAEECFVTSGKYFDVNKEKKND